MVPSPSSYRERGRQYRRTSVAVFRAQSAAKQSTSHQTLGLEGKKGGQMSCVALSRCLCSLCLCLCVFVPESILLTAIGVGISRGLIVLTAAEEDHIALCGLSTAQRACLHTNRDMRNEVLFVFDRTVSMSLHLFPYVSLYLFFTVIARLVSSLWYSSLKLYIRSIPVPITDMQVRAVIRLFLSYRSGSSP